MQLGNQDASLNLALGVDVRDATDDEVGTDDLDLESVVKQALEVGVTTD